MQGRAQSTPDERTTATATQTCLRAARPSRTPNAERAISAPRDQTNAISAPRDPDERHLRPAQSQTNAISAPRDPDERISAPRDPDERHLRPARVATQTCLRAISSAQSSLRAISRQVRPTEPC